jgi:hypothetical protein
MRCVSYNLNFKNDDFNAKRKCIEQLASAGNSVIALQEAKYHQHFVLPEYNAIATSFDFVNDECVMTLWEKNT